MAAAIGHNFREYMNASGLDICDHARAHVLFEGGRRLLESIARGGELSNLLDDLCRLVEGVVDGCHCTILLVDADRARMQHGAAPSLPDAYTRHLEGRPARPEFGPCGMAVAIRGQVIVQDVEGDERWAAREWSTLALAHGLRACWSTPILSPSGVPLGTFALYWRRPERPRMEHQDAIQQMTYIAAVAIERDRAAAALEQDRDRASADSRSVQDAVERIMRKAGADSRAIDELRKCYASLTSREREVMAWVVAGLPNKRISAELGTAEITVKVHRGRVMRKMQAASLPELVRMAARLDVPLPRERTARPYTFVQ